MNSRRYLLAVIVGAAPLAVMALGIAIRGFSGGSQDLATRNAAELDAQLATAGVLSHEGFEDQAQLVEAASMLSRPLEASSSSLSASERLIDLHARWQSRCQLLDWAGKLTSELKQIENVQELTDETVAQMTIGLQELQSQVEGSNIAGGDELRQVIVFYLGSLENEKQRRTQLAHNLQVLTRARSAFLEQRFDEGFAILESWQGPVSVEAESLRSHALFAKEATRIEESLAILEKSEPTVSWLSVLEEVRRFLNLETAIATDAKLSARKERIHDRLAVLDARYHLGTLSVPSDLRDWSGKVRQSLDVYSTPQTRQKIASLLTTCFAANLPEKLSDDHDMQMAVDTKGVLLEGYFEPQEDGRWYKFYAGTTRESAQLDPNAWGAKMAKTLKQGPKEIPTLQVGKDYGAARDKLLKSPFDIALWSDLADQLERWQLAIDEYKELGGKVDISFQNEISFSQQVIAAWHEIEPLLRKEIELPGEEASASFIRGNKFRDKGDLHSAIESWSVAIGLNPDYCRAYCHRGTAYALLGDEEKAEADFVRATQLDKTIPLLSRIRLSIEKPSGMMVQWNIRGVDAGALNSELLVVPGQIEFSKANVYRLKISNVEGYDFLERYPTIEIMPLTTKSAVCLAHTAVPVQFSDEDFDQVTSGNLVTKVMYIPHAQLPRQGRGDDCIATLTSTALRADQDPILEASRHGDIVAVLRIGNIDLEVPGDDDRLLEKPVVGQILFARPEFMFIQLDDGSGEFESEPLVVPGRMNFTKPGEYRLKLSNIEGYEGLELFATLTISPINGRVTSLLRHSALPIVLTSELVEQSFAGKSVTLVLYLPDPKVQKVGWASVAKLAGSSPDLVEQAGQLGTVIVTVRISEWSDADRGSR